MNLSVPRANQTGYVCKVFHTTHVLFTIGKCIVNQCRAILWFIWASMYMTMEWPFQSLQRRVMGRHRITPHRPTPPHPWQKTLKHSGLDSQLVGGAMCFRTLCPSAPKTYQTKWRHTINMNIFTEAKIIWKMNWHINRMILPLPKANHTWLTCRPGCCKSIISYSPSGGAFWRSAASFISYIDLCEYGHVTCLCSAGHGTCKFSLWEDRKSITASRSFQPRCTTYDEFPDANFDCFCVFVAREVVATQGPRLQKEVHKLVSNPVLLFMRIRRWGSHCGWEVSEE